MQKTGYDIIGDIHGYASKLELLLTQMGYAKKSGAWQHPDRLAIFVGDFVDKGPEQVRAVDTVRRMVEAESALAVMGNHELNAIAWHTADPRVPGEYLRRRYCPRWGPVNRKQHAAFLAEVETQPELHNEIIEWFLTLPLWIELPELRAIHACWHDEIIGWLSQRLRDQRFLNRELMVEVTDEPSGKDHETLLDGTLFTAVETITKGITVPLPEGQRLTDAYNHQWHNVRVRWWDDSATTFRNSALLSPEECSTLPDLELPSYARISRSGKPTFFGHYWLTGTPVLHSQQFACVDYSVGKGGPLVAYRFEPGQPLSEDGFVSVP
jgi:diadenosine tetraphosphatase ApaH/serine/threonine PP2A family protein phosphatase